MTIVELITFLCQPLRIDRGSPVPTFEPTFMQVLLTNN